MSDEINNLHLSQIDTMWSVVERAHRPGDSQFAAAQRALLDRYGGAVRRYAQAVLRDPDAADEVFQEFALKFVRGEFGKASPERGRFRSFLKTTLFHLMIDFQRRRQKQARHAPLATDQPQPHAATETPAEDAAFISSWRDELLSRVWQALDTVETTTGKAYHTVLRVRVDHPEARSPELAELITQRLAKPMTAGAVRVLLHRAREQFGELLLDEVAQSLSEPTIDAIEEELIELDLWQYCRDQVQARRSGAR